MTPRTLFDKVWSAHEVVAETRDTPAVLYVDLHLVHEVTTPQAFSMLKAHGLPVRRPDRTLATMDHSTPTQSAQVFGSVPIKVDAAAKQVRQMEAERGRIRHRAVRHARCAPRHRAHHRAGTRGDAAGHDHCVRRQPHEHPWSLWRPRLRDRHNRSRPRVRHAGPVAAQAEESGGQYRGSAAAGRHGQGFDPEPSLDRSASRAARATYWNIAARPCAHCRCTSA